MMAALVLLMLPRSLYEALMPIFYRGKTGAGARAFYEKCQFGAFLAQERAYGRGWVYGWSWVYLTVKIFDCLIAAAQS